MKVVITINVTPETLDELEEEMAFEQIEALLDDCHADYTWEESE